MPGTRQWIQRSFFFVLLLALVRSAASCPFCGPTEPPFSERWAGCDVALLATWESLVPGKPPVSEQTTFVVGATVKNGPRTFEKGDKIKWDVGLDGKRGDRYLLLGTIDEEKNMVWSPIAIDPEYYIFSYIKKAPAPETPGRLEFFLKYLEVPEPAIANDAYAEFSRASFKDVAALASKLPRAKLREWLSSHGKEVSEFAAPPNQSPFQPPAAQVRLGLYGMMLGLCGDDDDAAFLEKLVLKRPDPKQPRFGIDGMMAGYIMLRGERGLDKLIAAKFDDPEADSDLPLLKNALVFLWDFCQDRIPPQSLRAAMRRMLDRPKWAFGVLENLARWKDWDSLDRVVAAYGKAPFDSQLSKEKVVQFALVCEKDGLKKSPNPLPASAIKAREFLNTLDPALVKSAERSLGGLR